MAQLFKTIDEVFKNCRANKSLNMDTFSIYEPMALEKYVRRYLGDDQLEEIITWYADDEPDQSNTALLALLPYVQSCTAKFALACGAPDLDVVLNESGFGVVNNQNLAPASEKRVAAFIANQEELGYVAVESMLRFLETNKGDYPAWADSDAYTTKWEYFIPNAGIYAKIVSIKESRKAYLDVLSLMDSVETSHIIPLIGTDFASILKQKQEQQTLSDEYLDAMVLVRKATAFLTRFMETGDMVMERVGKGWVSSLKQYLQAHADALPEYADGEAYEDKGPLPNYENDSNSSIFVAGSFPIN